MTRVKEAPCPRCRRSVPVDDPFFPFCSDRCRLIDLGHWLDEDYRAPGEDTEVPVQPGLDEDQENGTDSGKSNWIN